MATDLPSSVTDRRQSGLALLAVLVVLGVLMALLGPFLLSMTHQDNAASCTIDREQVRLLVDSAVDAITHRAAELDKSVDRTPSADGPGETDIRWQPGKEFGGLVVGQEPLMSAVASDEQARVNLRSATPLVLGNLLDLVTFTSTPIKPEDTEISCGDLSAFPDAGWVVVGNELVRYASKDGGTLKGCERGLLAIDKDPESAFFLAGDHPADTMVLDMRVRLAVTYPIDECGANRRAWHPWPGVDDLARISELQFGAFTRAMIEKLRPFVTTWSARDNGGEWLKPERVFGVGSDLVAGVTRDFQVKSAEYMGPGTIVRITGDDQPEEYALVREARPFNRGGRDVQLVGKWLVTLERPVAFARRDAHAFAAALAPHPVNVNTASRDLLINLFQPDFPGYWRP